MCCPPSEGELSPSDDLYAKTSIRQRFGERATATTLSQIFSGYPSATVGVQDCWEEPFLLNFTTHDSVQVTARPSSLCALRLSVCLGLGHAIDTPILFSTTATPGAWVCVWWQWLRANRTSCLAQVKKEDHQGVTKVLYHLQDTAPIETVSADPKYTDVWSMKGVQNGTAVVVPETG